MPMTDALNAIWNSTGDGVNWGQTGTYFLFNHFSGSLFGANLWALRVPSIAAGSLLMLSAVWFMRCRGFTRGWQLLIIIVFGAQPHLMHYIGEARPYMPMVAAAVATLAFYTTSLEARQKFVAKIIGFAGLLVGAAFHPYWLPFTTFAILFGYWVTRRHSSEKSDWHLKEFLALPLLLPASVIYVISGALTWMKAQRSFQFDPFGPLGGPIRALRAFLSQHFSTLRIPGLTIYDADQLQPVIPGEYAEYVLRLPTVLLIALLLTLMLVNVRFRRGLIEPVVLLSAGVFSSLVLAGLSYSRDYWVFPRQWLAGIALVSLSLTWALAKAWEVANVGNTRWLQRSLGAFAVLIGLLGAETLHDSISKVAGHRDRMAQYVLEIAEPGELVKSSLEMGDPSFAANVNVARGGPIWPEHGLYYGVVPSK